MICTLMREGGEKLGFSKGSTTGSTPIDDGVTLLEAKQSS